MTKATERWASTWSGPFCASSSMTKIAVVAQYLLCEHGLDQAAEREVVVGDVGARRRRARPRPLRVVVADAHDLELRQPPVLFELAELREPGVDPLLSGIARSQRGKRRAEVAFERLLHRCSSHGPACGIEPLARHPAAAVLPSRMLTNSP